MPLHGVAGELQHGALSEVVLSTDPDGISSQRAFKHDKHRSKVVVEREGQTKW